MSGPPADDARRKPEADGSPVLLPISAAEVAAALEVFPVESGSRIQESLSTTGGVEALAAFSSTVTSEQAPLGAEPSVTPAVNARPALLWALCRRLKPHLRISPARPTLLRPIVVALLAVVLLKMIGGNLGRWPPVTISPQGSTAETANTPVGASELVLPYRTTVPSGWPMAVPTVADLRQRGVAVEPARNLTRPAVEVQPRQNATGPIVEVHTGRQLSGPPPLAAPGPSAPTAGPGRTEAAMPSDVLSDVDRAQPTASLLGDSLATSGIKPTAEVELPPLRLSDTAIIQSVVSRYRTAINSLDASAAKQVWPGLDRRALERAFDRVEHAKIEFDNCQVRVRGFEAVASCRGNDSYVPKIGSKRARSEARAWTFKLRKMDEEWLIVAVDAR